MKQLELKSPDNERNSIFVDAQVANLSSAFNGNLSCKEGVEFPIDKNIINLLTNREPKSTLAQMSNHWKLTASVYEDVWRVNALSMLSGEKFPIQKEQELLIDWIDPESGHTYLDAGCSTALYTRAIGKKIDDAQLIALDFSKEMLSEARKKCLEDDVDCFLLRADASELPFFSSSLDGIVCGGSLNEFYDPAKVLYEFKRVLKSGGSVFMMHLLSADTWYGKLLQEPMKAGGLHFWNKKESNELFERTGFAVEKQEVHGIVCFSKLRPMD
jgi:ubiquinone/menaquinone biosynthesis C-methylase UbiE